MFNAIKDREISDTGVLTGLRGQYDCISGIFEKDGQDGYMVVNYANPASNRSNTITMEFAGCKDVVIYREGIAETMPLVDGEVKIMPGCGEGVFVIPV